MARFSPHTDKRALLMVQSILAIPAAKTGKKALSSLMGAEDTDPLFRTATPKSPATIKA